MGLSQQAEGMDRTLLKSVQNRKILEIARALPGPAVITR